VDLTGHRIYIHTVFDITERKRLERLRNQLVFDVIRSQDDERRRIARELHDGTAQTLASLAMRIGHLEPIDDVPTVRSELAVLRGQVTEATAELRRLARGLHPRLLDNLGLAAALESHIADFTEATGIAVDLHITGLDSQSDLGRVLALSLFRIVQEALNNVAKHAQAGRASVVIDVNEQEVRLVVEDNGSGIADERALAAADASGRAGLGLTSMRERASLLGGTLVVERRPEGGTSLFVRVPLPESGE
jgi:signal transduction histidine kinase